MLIYKYFYIFFQINIKKVLVTLHSNYVTVLYIPYPNTHLNN